MLFNKKIELFCHAVHCIIVCTVYKRTHLGMKAAISNTSIYAKKVKIQSIALYYSVRIIFVCVHCTYSILGLQF